MKKTRMLDIVCGTDYVRTKFAERMKVEDIEAFWMKDAAAFKDRSAQYYLY